MTSDQGGPRQGGPRQGDPHSSGPNQSDLPSAGTPHVLVVTGLAFEAAIARRCAGVEVLFGVGTAAAAILQARLRDANRRPAGIVSFGTAGALDALYQPGDCLLARAVLERAGPGASDPAGTVPSKSHAGGVQRHAVDARWLERLAATLPGAVCVDFAGSATPVISATQKHLLHVRTGAAAVDMESAALARVAAAHGLPFIVCRVVIDRASHTLPPAALAGMHADGSTRILPVLASLLRHPMQLPSLLRLARDAGRARRALTDLARRMPPGFGMDAAFATHAGQSS